MTRFYNTQNLSLGYEDADGKVIFAKINDDQINLIRKEHSEGVALNQLAEEWACSIGFINKVLKI